MSEHDIASLSDLYCSGHEALTLAQELSHPHSLAFALSIVTEVHLLRQEWQIAQERAEAVIALSTEQGFAYWWGTGTLRRGRALIEQGQGEEGIAQVCQGIAAYRATGAEATVPHFLSLLAEAYRKVEQTEEGLSVLAEALAIVDKTGECWWESGMYRLKGELTLQQVKVQGSKFKVEEAEECFQKAIDIARRQSAKSLELCATVSLARLWQQQGKQKEAHQMLADIYGWFTEGFDTKDLQGAKALLDELSERGR